MSAEVRSRDAGSSGSWYQVAVVLDMTNDLIVLISIILSARIKLFDIEWVAR